MQAEIRRIVAVEAHRRRSGACPVRVDSLGTGESFDIRPTGDGFVDVDSGLTATSEDRGVAIAELNSTVALRLHGDVAFDGFDPISGEVFSGRAGGGASVTIYDKASVDFFQYAVVTDDRG